MADCYDIHNFNLKSLTFSKCSDKNEGEDEIINILDFNVPKVYVESKNRGDFEILYYNKPLKIKITLF